MVCIPYPSNLYLFIYSVLGIYIQGDWRPELRCSTKKEIQLHWKHPGRAFTPPILLRIPFQSWWIRQPRRVAFPRQSCTPASRSILWAIQPTFESNPFHEQPWSASLEASISCAAHHTATITVYVISEGVWIYGNGKSGQGGNWSWSGSGSGI